MASRWFTGELLTLSGLVPARRLYRANWSELLPSANRRPAQQKPGRNRGLGNLSALVAERTRCG